MKTVAGGRGFPGRPFSRAVRGAHEDKLARDTDQVEREVGNNNSSRMVAQGLWLARGPRLDATLAQSDGAPHVVKRERQQSERRCHQAPGDVLRPRCDQDGNIHQQPHCGRRVIEHQQSPGQRSIVASGGPVCHGETRGDGNGGCVRNRNRRADTRRIYGWNEHQRARDDERNHHFLGGSVRVLWLRATFPQVFISSRPCAHFFGVRMGGAHPPL